MSLLNSKVFKTFAGSASDLISNLLDHSPVSAASTILNRGVTRIHAQESAVESLLAPFSSFSDMFSNRLSVDYDGDISREFDPTLDVNTQFGALKGAQYSSSTVNQILSYLGSSTQGNIVVSLYNEASTIILNWEEHITQNEHWINLNAMIPGGEVVDICHFYWLAESTISVSTRAYSPFHFRAFSGATVSPGLLPVTYVIWCLFNHIHAFTSYNLNNGVMTLLEKSMGFHSVDELGFINDATLVPDIIESIVDAGNNLGEYVSNTGYDRRFTITSLDGACYLLHLAYNNAGNSIYSAYWNHLWRYPAFIQTANSIITFPWAFATNAKKVTIAEILSAITISSQINDFISTASVYANSTVTDAAGLASALSNRAHLWHDSVKNLCAGAINVLKKGGPHALTTYLDGYFATGASTSDDGPMLFFSDTSSWVPKNYIAGIINAISDVVSVIGAAIAVVFSRIVGIAVTCVGLLAKLFVNIFTAPYDQTKYTLSDAPDALPLSGQYATCKGKFLRANVSSDLLATLDANSDIFALNVIGGYLLVGPARYQTINDETVITEWNWEFHPDMLDRSKALRSLYYSDHNSIMRSCLVVSNIDRPEKCDIQFTINSLHTIPFFEMSDINAALAAHAPAILTPNSEGRTSNLLHINNCAFGNTLFFLSSMGDELFDVTLNLNSSATRVRRINDSTIGIQGAGVTAWMMYMYGLDPTNSYAFTPRRVADLINSYCGGEAIFLNTANITEASFEQLNLAYGPNLIASECSYLMANLNKDSDPLFTDLTIQDCITLGRFSGQLLTITNGWSYYLICPEYSLASVITTSVVGGVLAALAIAGTIYVAVKVVPKIQARRAQNAAKVEQAWSNLTKEPTTENAMAYRKAVKRANFQSKIFGGSKFSKTNYWEAGGSSESSGLKPGKTISSLLLTSDDTAVDGVVTQVAATSEISHEVDLSKVITLITGVQPA